MQSAVCNATFAVQPWQGSRLPALGNDFCCRVAMENIKRLQVHVLSPPPPTQLLDLTDCSEWCMFVRLLCPKKPTQIQTNPNQNKPRQTHPNPHQNKPIQTKTKQPKPTPTKPRQTNPNPKEPNQDKANPLVLVWVGFSCFGLFGFELVCVWVG